MKRLLALFVAVAAAVVLAGVYLPSDAATVGSTGISRHSLDADLSAISKSTEYSCFLSEERQLAGQAAAPVQGAGTSDPGGSGSDSTYSVAFTDDWLGSMITDQASASVAADHGLEVTPAEVAMGQAVLTRRITGVLNEYAEATGAQVAGCGGSGSAVLASLPGWFVHQQAIAEGTEAILDAHAAGASLGTVALSTYYAAHRASFDRYCVSLIVVKTSAAATSAGAAIAAGTTFAQEASAVSITSGIAASGGKAGCGMIVGSFLSSHLEGQPIGVVTAPFSGEGVWWLAEVTGRTAQPLSAVRGNVVTSILDAGQTRADAEVTAALRKSDVTVDPRYGTAGSGHATLIDPPVAPPPGSLLSAAANVPAPTSTAS